MTLLAQAREELLHSLDSLVARGLAGRFLDLVVLQVAQRLDHEARARTQRVGVRGQFGVYNLYNALERGRVVLPQLLTGV